MSDQQNEETTSRIRFVGDRARANKLALDWPVELNGTTYTSIGLRRLTAGEVSAYIESLRELQKASPDGEVNVRPPIFTTEQGEPLPEGLLEALDDDDAFRLDEAAEDFLPRRFRGAGMKSSAPTDGSGSEPTS